MSHWALDIGIFGVRLVSFYMLRISITAIDSILVLKNGRQELRVVWLNDIVIINMDWLWGLAINLKLVSWKLNFPSSWKSWLWFGNLWLGVIMQEEEIKCSFYSILELSRQLLKTESFSNPELPLLFGKNALMQLNAAVLFCL